MLSFVTNIKLLDIHDKSTLRVEFINTSEPDGFNQYLLTLDNEYRYKGLFVYNPHQKQYERIDRLYSDSLRTDITDTVVTKLTWKDKENNVAI